jgi:AraC family transcriptional regulator
MKFERRLPKIMYDYSEMNRVFNKTKLFGESLTQQKVSAFTLTERFYSPFFETPSHSHEKSLFCFVVKGSYTETYGKKNIDCSPSDFLFHASDFPHAEQYHQNGGHSFIIEVETDWLKSIREQVNFPTFSVDFKGGTLPELGAKLYREFRHFDSLSPLIIEGVMMEIAGETARTVSFKESNAPLWLKRTETLLIERFADSFSIAELAEFAKVHPIHLAQTFRKFHGTTIGQFVRKLRLENASKQLLKTQNSCTEIASANGFSDQSHFTRLFKTHFGITPNQFRQNNS